MVTQWSPELESQMAALSPGQRRAIAMIVAAEMDNRPVARLWRTPYSCRFCGLVCGHSSDGREARKAQLASHEESCERRGQAWQFAANFSTYYSAWKQQPAFLACLDAARQEVLGAALTDAARSLKLAAPAAVAELRRQVGEGEKDTDRRAAAVAILDRADVQTAGKGFDPLARWLAELREASDE